MVSRKQSGRRPWIALILAYAFALNAMLAGSIASQHAAEALASSDPAVICFGMGASSPSDDGSGLQRQHHLPCSICALADLPVLADIVAALMVPEQHKLPVITARATLSAGHTERSPRLSQGPPSDA